MTASAVLEGHGLLKEVRGNLIRNEEGTSYYNWREGIDGSVCPTDSKVSTEIHVLTELEVYLYIRCRRGEAVEDDLVGDSSKVSCGHRRGVTRRE